MKKKVDAMAEVRKHPDYKKYYREATVKLNVGMGIYKARNELNISQKELAEKVGSTQKVISRIENGDVNVGVCLLDRLVRETKLNQKQLIKFFNSNPHQSKPKN